MNPRGDLERLAALLVGRRAEALAADDLAGWLYEHWYTAPAAPCAPSDYGLPRAGLGEVLGGIIDDAGGWSADWIALRAGPGAGCLAGRRDVQRWAEPGRYAGPGRPGMPLVPGERLALPNLLSWIDAATGQWAAQSEQAPDGRRVRLYVNVDVDAVGVAVDRIARWLVAAGVAFSLKCPGKPDAFGRVDTLVLYLAEADWPALEPGARACAEQLAPRLRPDVPALVLRLGPGFGFAEDPGDGRSFGESRCAILAAAAGAALRAGAAPIEAFEATLAAAGLDPARPCRRAA